MNTADQELGTTIQHFVEDIFGYYVPAAVQTVVRLDIADHLQDGPRTAAELAKLADADPGSLERVLRFLASRGVFRTDEDGRFHLTPLSALLRSGVEPSLRPLVEFTGHEIMWRVTAGLPRSVTLGQPVFEEMYGLPAFDYMNEHPDFGAVFAKGMSAYSGTEEPELATGYPWPADATVVDVGGGRGGLLRALLERHPRMKGILFDQEAVVADHLLDVPGLAGRWRTVAGDFRESVPAGGDFHVLKHVLHNWSQDDCLRILGNCRAALNEGGRLLIVAPVIPPGDAWHLGKIADLVMMAFLPGQQRTRAEFDSLLGAAGFRIRQVLPTASFTSVIEAEPVSADHLRSPLAPVAGARTPADDE